ncbi:putative transcriptional regulatory protein [Emericellopsis cladophorae]|uniref:Transcriptional regulatory protein n=1 Tax=Emericellopsis cladophorae TaxID=2686198 RepID=A0A9Q0BCE5_9HYPO|nr:putative transcriptional regulatory protein [Emericellopsis cladophorae]KAI6780262.1 putative transcriptional regulatory protein [Emericellopsis cladophorae]
MPPPRPPGTPPTSRRNLSRASDPSRPLLPTRGVSSDRDADGPPLPDQCPGGLAQINKHTEGAEYYGPTGTFYFLSRLRSQADSHRHPTSPPDSGRDVYERSPADTAVVNLLHSSDYAAASGSYGPGSRQGKQRVPYNDRLGPGGSRDGSFRGTRGRSPASDPVIEQECVRLYFQNQHCIHPVLDQAAFTARCGSEIWNQSQTLENAASPHIRSHARFLALYNTVVAIGAVNAGETSMLTWHRAHEFLNQAETLEHNRSPYLPIRVARLFFERAKLLLEDVFESASLETAQTLFLMSVFCQDALKPHACYMYSGMAVRAALAMGIPTTPSGSNQKRLLWWALYSHETEMCSSAGRQSFLKEPSHYSIDFPVVSASHGPSLYIISCMVELAKILARISQNVWQPDVIDGPEHMSGRAANLEGSLLQWKSRLPHELDFDVSTLEESELITKQKIVLKLRFLNAKILLYRPFLITRAGRDRAMVSQHVASCIEAARETIAFMHSTYRHRPYFRTWWYNCTYVLDASMVLLYVILSNICPLPAEDIFSSVEMSLEIFRVMRMVVVARRCTEITQDVLDIAKQSRCDGQGQPVVATRPPSVPCAEERTLLNQLSSALPDGSFEGEVGGRMDGFQAEPYAGLVDTNLLYNLLNFEDWNAWSEAGWL